MTSKHTPGPWEKQTDSYSILAPERFDNEEGGRIIAHITDDRPLTEQWANAQFIVQACNSHYELLEALKKLVPITWNDGPLAKAYEAIGKQAEEAIAKAEGKEVER